jgi:hypothetical protein
VCYNRYYVQTFILYLIFSQKWLWCNALQSGRSQPTFQKNILADGAASFFSLKMVAIWPSGTPTDFHRTTWHYIPDNRNLHKYLFDLSKILTGADNFGLIGSSWRMGFWAVNSWLICWCFPSGIFPFQCRMVQQCAIYSNDALQHLLASTDEDHRRLHSGVTNFWS